MLHQLFGKDSQKTSVSLLIIVIYLTSSPCTLLCYIPLTTEEQTLQSILSCFYSCATTCPPTSPFATVAPRCLLGLTSWILIWHQTKWEVWLLRSWFDIVNKLVSLTWLLWALRIFWRFTFEWQCCIKAGKLLAVSGLHICECLKNKILFRRLVKKKLILKCSYAHLQTMTF